MATRKYIYTKLIFLFILTFLYVGCASKDGSQPLSFTNVLQGNVLRSPATASSQAKLVILTSQAEANVFIHDNLDTDANASTNPQHQLVQNIQAADYRNSIDILVLQGVKLSNGFKVDIQDIRMKNNEISIYVLFDSPQQSRGLFGSTIVQPMSTDPYQLVRVPRNSFNPGKVVFSLVVEDTIIDTATHVVT